MMLFTFLSILMNVMLSMKRSFNDNTQNIITLIQICVVEYQPERYPSRKKNAYRYANLGRKRSPIFKFMYIFFTNIHAFMAKVCQKYTLLKRRWRTIDMLRMTDAFLFP